MRLDADRGAQPSRGHMLPISVIGLLQCESGQSVVEFAVFVPFVLALLLGLAEIGRYAHYAIMVHNVARAGVQYGAQNHVTAADSAGMKSAALNDAPDVPALAVSPAPTAYEVCEDAAGNLSGPLPYPTACPDPSQREILEVEVDASATIPSMFNFPFVPPALTVSSKAVMRVQQ